MPWANEPSQSMPVHKTGLPHGQAQSPRRRGIDPAAMHVGAGQCDRLIPGRRVDGGQRRLLVTRPQRMAEPHTHHEDVSGSRPSGLFRRTSRWLRSMDIASLALRAPIRSSRPKVWAHCVKCVWQSHNPGITQRPSASMMGAVPPVAVAEIREPAGVIAAIAPPLIAMSTRRALPGNRALVIIVIIPVPAILHQIRRSWAHVAETSYISVRASVAWPVAPIPFTVPPNCVASPSASRLNRLSNVHASLL